MWVPAISAAVDATAPWKRLGRWVARQSTGLLEGSRIWIVLGLLMGTHEALLETVNNPSQVLQAGVLLLAIARHSGFVLLMLLPIFAGLLVLDATLPARGGGRVLGLIAGTLASCALGAMIFHHPGDGDPHSLRAFLFNWLALWVPAGLVVAIHEVLRQEAMADERARTLRVQDTQLEAELSRARLQLLQAQIEPHFFFNTLAHVELLYRTDARAAERMLDALIDYLESSLPALRSSRSSLSEERALLAAYLEIHRIRLGTRLSYRMRIPRALGAAEVPSMMLLTLVENAIKHGINPLPRGGRIVVQAAQRGAGLEISVTDSGQGLSDGQGGGVGLANLKARLATQFGSSANFDLRSSPDQGTSAVLSLPLSLRPPSGGGR
jgi:signal transduction histidine kinase